MLDFEAIQADLDATKNLVHKVQEQVEVMEVERPETNRVRKPLIRSTDILSSEKNARDNAWRNPDGSLRNQGIHAAEIRSKQQALINKIGK